MNEINKVLDQIIGEVKIKPKVLKEKDLILTPKKLIGQYISNKKMTHKEYIEVLINNNYLKIAISSLQEGVKFSQQKDLANNLILLSGRFKRNEDERNAGRLDIANYNTEHSRIGHAFLSYLKDYAESPNFQFTIDSEVQNLVNLEKKGESVPEPKKEINNSKKQNLKNAHFKVAVSFPGEKRDYVEETVNELAKIIGSKNIFYDKWYDTQLARTGIDVILQNIYNKSTDLVVVFLCKAYNEKDWCGIEWRAIKDLINTKKGEKIMLLTFDYEKVDGLFTSTDGMLDLRKRTEKQVAADINERLNFM